MANLRSPPPPHAPDSRTGPAGLDESGDAGPSVSRSGAGASAPQEEKRQDGDVHDGTALSFARGVAACVDLTKAKTSTNSDYLKDIAARLGLSGNSPGPSPSLSPQAGRGEEQRRARLLPAYSRGEAGRGARAIGHKLRQMLEPARSMASGMSSIAQRGAKRKRRQRFSSAARLAKQTPAPRGAVKVRVSDRAAARPLRRARRWQAAANL